MRGIVNCFIAGLIALSLTGHARSGEPTGAEAARSVIQSQLGAFEDQSVIAAYGYAAPNIQRIFPTPEVFGRMVREGYPMIWNPAETMFLDAEEQGDVLLQRLRVIDQAGVPYIAEYMMVPINGEWRVAGVQIKKDESFGV